MTIDMRFLQSFFLVLEDYCRKSSLAGLKYIANPKRHFTERLFWICCFLSSIGASYFLITEYMEQYQTDPINIIVEPRSANEVYQFPSVGVCEIGDLHEPYPRFDEIIKNMNIEWKEEERDQVEGFLLQAIYPNLKNQANSTAFCNGNRCPLDNYKEFMDIVRANCTELIADCKFNDRTFACCDYFKPLSTNIGTCFLLNSIQVSEKNSKEWIDLSVGMETGTGKLRLDTHKPIWFYILNEEDIPNNLVSNNKLVVSPKGYRGRVVLSMQKITNDESVRRIEPAKRKCYFPDEKFDTKYKYYSYSVCVTECLRRVQLTICNCTHHFMIFDDNDELPVCGYAGFACLERNNLIFPVSTMMQPWNPEGLHCLCYPSCTEHEIRVVGFSRGRNKGKNRSTRSITVVLQQIPNQRYRRQTVREKMDVIVSVGGILGLFLGASLLSLLELIYFFTVRLLVTYCQRCRYREVAAHKE